MNAGVNEYGSLSRPKLEELEHWIRRTRRHTSFD
jgi:hypothetical protein